MAGRKGEMAGSIHGEIHFTPLANAIKHISEANPELLKIMNILAL